MSTRCHIIVDDLVNGHNIILYRHSDGYPDGPHGVLATLVPFVARFMKHRGWDPMYLAAQIMCDQINHYRESLRKFHRESAADERAGASRTFHEQRLTEVDNDFLGFGISNEIHGDVEFIYRVTQLGVHVEHPNGDKLTLDQEALAMLQGEIPKRFK